MENDELNLKKIEIDSKKRIAILTYNQPHRKTYDTICLLKSKGYKNVIVYSQAMTYKKKKYPLISHRPELIMNIPEPKILCANLGYEYIEGNFDNIEESKNTIFLLCGAGILPDSFITKYKIINSHPGYIPFARGLDAYKWSVYNNLPIGVTTHFLGEYVDAGEVIERREIQIGEWDTFHAVSQKIYENEIDMLVHAIELIDEPHIYIIPETDKIFKRMPEKLEKELFTKFDKLRNK